LVTKQGTWKAKLPTQYRTSNNKKKILKQEGDKLDYQITKCVVCAKKKMEKYNMKDPKGELVTINKCKNCKYTNASVVTVSWNSDGDNPYSVNYFNPNKAIEDKS
jgi:hypothetical protein